MMMDRTSDHERSPASRLSIRSGLGIAAYLAFHLDKQCGKEPGKHTIHFINTLASALIYRVERGTLREPRGFDGITVTFCDTSTVRWTPPNAAASSPRTTPAATPRAPSTASQAWRRQKRP